MKTNNKTNKGIMLLLISILLIGVALANQCNDGIDNDKDGKIDYPQDNGCSGATDNTESIILGYADGCLVKGDKLKNVFGEVTYDCETTQCLICVLMTEAGNYTVIGSKCYDSPKCSFGGGGSSIDLDKEAPHLIVNSPSNNQMFNSKLVLLDMTFNEPSSIYYIDNNDLRSGYKKLCTECSSSYSKSLSFDEGLQNLTFKAEDKSGNAAFVTRVFRVDYNSPNIKSTSPLKGYSDGTFSVEFTEPNPTKVQLYYGLSGKEKVLNINLADCTLDSSYKCEVSVNLLEFDNKQINYYFKVTDIVGNVASSQALVLDVDMSGPKITNLNYTIDGKYVYFAITIDDDYFSEAGYSYIDSNGKEKMMKLCSKLNFEGVCEKKVTFKDGSQNIKVYVIDGVGHKTTRDVSFFIDSIKPKIKKTIPTKGFSDGNFYVEFDEANPTKLELIYGVYGNEKTLKLNLANCVYEKTTKCNVDVDLSVYNSMVIKYYFKLTDITGNSVSSKVVSLDVDTVAPKINNPGSFWTQGTGSSSKYLYLKLNVTEENLFDISYIDNNDRNPKWKKLCSSLKNGVCEKKVSFTKGSHYVNVAVTDKAGNSVSTSNIVFDVA